VVQWKESAHQGASHIPETAVFFKLYQIQPYNRLLDRATLDVKCAGQDPAAVAS